MIDTNELRRLAQAVSGLGNCNQTWLDQSEDIPAVVVGHIGEDGETYPVVTIDCDQYYAADQSLPLGKFYAAANPAVINEILDRLEAAEKERDNYKSACNEWAKKTEWVQCGINDGSVPPRYLGWHRADVVADLLRAGEKERDALRAEIADRTINVEYLDKLKKSYEKLIGNFQEERDELRVRIEAIERQEPETKP